MACNVEMCVGLGIAVGTGINQDGNGNDPYTHGN